MKNDKIRHRIESLVLSLVLIGVFFLPFNSYVGLSFLGEFGKESSTLFFLAAFLVLLFKALSFGSIKIPLKNPLFQILLLFYSCVILSSLVNVTDIYSHYFKHTSGISRSIRQYFVLFLSGVFFLITYYNAFVQIDYKLLFLRIRKVISYSFVIVSIYAVFEILILKFHYYSLEPLLNLFEYFPFTSVDLDTRNFRVSSVTFEPPALATYLFSIMGWMSSYILTDKGFKRFIPALWTVTLALFSGSRAALVIIFIQLLIFLALLINRKYFRTFLQIIKYAFFLILILSIFKGKAITNYIVDRATSFQVKDDVHYMSNQSRFGIQYANFLVFIKSPIFGEGLGQQAYIAKDLYPEWATENNWEFREKYLNEDVKSFPPGYNIYIRLLAETGIIGFLVFVFLLIAILFVTLKIIRQKNEKQLMAIVILVSMIGLTFNWLKMDTFRVFTFWINFALLLVISKNTLRIQN